MPDRFFVIACLSAHLFLFAGLPTVLSQEYSYRHYSVQDGLPQNQTICLHQDRNGYIWIGTKGGLSRFDGVSFKNFSVHDGLLANHISHIREDKNGSLYLFSDLGLNIFQHDSIRTEFRKDTIKNIRDVFLVLSRNDLEVWLKRSNRIHVIAGEAKGKSFILPPELANTRLFNAVWVPEIKEYWFGAEGKGIYTWDGRQVNLQNDNKTIRFSYVDNSNFLAVDNGAIFRVDPLRKKFTRIVESDNIKIGRLSQGKDGVIYFTDLKRIFSHDSAGLHHWNREFNYINDLMVDRENHLWIATETGLYKRISDAFDNFTGEDGFPEYVWTIVEDDGGTIWCASYGNGLCKYSNGQVYKVKDYTSVYPNILGHYFYTGAHKCSNGDLFFPVKNEGVLSFDGQNYRLLNDLPESSVMDVFEDVSSGKFLFASTSGVVVWSNKKDTVLLEKPQANTRQYIKTISQDKFDRYWMGGEYILTVFDGEEMIEFPNKKVNYDAGAISIHRDFRGNMWLGTTSGLYYYDYSEFHPIAPDLLGSQVASFAESDSSILYMGVSRGLAVLRLDSFYQRSTVKIDLLDAARGFLGFDCIRNGILLDSRGDLWVAASEQVIRYHPERLLPDTIPPEIHIERLSFTAKDGSEPLNFNQIKDSMLRLSGQYNNVRIAFHSVHQRAPEKIQYKYRLRGLDASWSDLTPDRYASYTNLQPGKYRFEVKARNIDEHWSLQPETIQFHIVPFFYQTWQFRIISRILVILIVLGIGYGVLTFFRRRKEIQEETEQQIMELQLKTIRNQMDPHFTFNALNTISSVIYKEDKEKAYRYMGKFSRLVRSSLEFSDQIARSLKEELHFTQDYLDLEKIRFQDDFSYTIEKDTGLDESVRVPKMIVQNYAENAVKHGLRHKSSNRILWIRIHQKDRAITIDIEDNGVGRQMAESKKMMESGHGMKIMSNIFDLYYKLYGVQIEHTIEDLFDPFGQAKGTRVRVIVPRNNGYIKKKPI